jgi:hypothetical protein
VWGIDCIQVAQVRVEQWDPVNIVLKSMKYCLQEWYGQLPVDKTELSLPQTGKECSITAIWLDPKNLLLQNIYLFAGIDFALVHLHHPKVVSVADILELRTTSIFRLK